MLQLVLQAVPIQRGSADGQVSYIASMSFGDAARLLDLDYLYVANQAELADLAQRKLNIARVNSIAQYILENHAKGTIFFPPVCVNIQPAPLYNDGRLLLPYSSVTMRLTDGQHRCFGIRQALKQSQSRDPDTFSILSRLEIGVLVYSALSLEDERQAFRDQNLLVQRPSVSLSHYFDQRSPEVLIAKALMQRVSCFRDNIEQIERGLGSKNSKLITLSTLVTATRYMFPNLKNNHQFEFKLEWAVHFWETISKIFPNDPWQLKDLEEQRQQRKSSLLVSAVLFQALGMLGHDLLVEGVSPDELIKWLNRLQEVDWHRIHPLWLNKGITQPGVKGEVIISNTKTTVELCHQALREFIGLASITNPV
ncbi:DNA sulfur modification protein DndB [Pannus brasiliensis CCIBt3594]|uniref:DNA sulfur modification protein DndB n=1 Tax=Pannus brasiliensis CCIBt3594 TaxID=1427578 RepID=A0AAW9QVA1_9CHRO